MVHHGKEAFEIQRGYDAAFGSENNVVVFKIKPHADSLRLAKLNKVKKEKMPADSLGILLLKNNDLVKLVSRRGEVVLKARVTDVPNKGLIFVPWFDKKQLINLVTIDAFDPGSKQPEFKICAVKVSKA